MVELCILAGSKSNDIILDPFGGANTTGCVALKHSRKFISIKLNSDYVKIANDRTAPHLNKKRLESDNNIKLIITTNSEIFKQELF